MNAAEIPLTDFTDATINNLLSGVLSAAEPPPYDRIAAGFFATNPGATSATFSIGNLTVLLARLDPTEPQNLGTAALPPIPGAPADAVGYFATRPFGPEASNMTGASISIGLSTMTGSEVQVAGLSDPVIIAFEPSNDTECVFWNTTTESWSTDGCTTVGSACHCNHLTEFGRRFAAIADVQKGIFNSLGRLATLEGLLAALPVIILIAAIGTSLVAMVAVLLALDRRGYRCYAEALDGSAEFELLRDRIRLGDESWDKLFPKGRSRELSAGLEVPVPPTVPQRIGQVLKYWLIRLPFNHPYLSVFFRFNPAGPRIYRGILISCGLLTSVAISILFYGYKNGAATGIEQSLEISETIVLSLITTAVSLPLSVLLNKISELSGSYEYRARYPALSAELVKVQRFLQIAKSLDRDQLRAELENYEKRIYSATPVNIYDDFTDVATPVPELVADPAATLAATITSDSVGAIETSLLYSLVSCLWSRTSRQRLCCPGERQRFRRGILQFIRRYSHVHAFRNRGNSLCGPSWLPIHTPVSAVLTLLLFGWMGACCVYILGFTSFKDSSATMTIFKSIAISQATTALIVNPVLQLATLLIPYYQNRHRDPEDAIFYRLELFLYKATTEFVAQASYIPCIKAGKAERAVAIISPELLMKKLETNLTEEDQRLEARIQTIFWAID